MLSHDNVIGYHTLGLTFTWFILFNLTLFFMQFRYKKIAVLLHTLIGLFILILVISLTGILLFPTGFCLTPDEGYILYVHGLLGLFIIGATVIQCLVGYFVKLTARDHFVEYKILKKRQKIHKICGIMLSFLCKINILVMWLGQEMFSFLIIIQLMFWVAFVYAKKYKLRLEQQSNKQIISHKAPIINSINQLDTNEYIIFSDLIYDISPLKQNHPAGFQIISDMKGRQIDRYLYGMHYSEFLPSVKPYSHSAKSLHLLGNPIARLSNTNHFQLFSNTDEAILVKVKNFEIISQRSRIYILHLTSILGNNFGYLGYESLKQFGQYYTLALPKKLTRLYTCVNMLSLKNMKLNNQIFKQMNIDLSKDSFNIIQSEEQNQISNLSINQQFEKDTDTIPIMIKFYQKGKFNSQLQRNLFQNLQLRRPRGQGLKLYSFHNSNIIATAGGTGFYPFMDLIDMLFKKQLIKENHHLASSLIESNPLLKENVFESFSLTLFAAFECPKDLHLITANQMNYLMKVNNRLKFVIRFKQTSHEYSQIYNNIIYISEKFHQQAASLAGQKNPDIFLICGPPRMTASVLKQLNFHRFPQAKIHLI